MKLMIAPAIIPPPPKKKNYYMPLMGCAAGTWKKLKDSNLLIDRTLKLLTFPTVFFPIKKSTYILRISRLMYYLNSNMFGFSLSLNSHSLMWIEQSFLSLEMQIWLAFMYYTKVRERGLIYGTPYPPMFDNSHLEVCSNIVYSKK